ncbi:MAG TPA: S8 family peptidase [Casimicrobiaceae bacterium]|nr:S8 family peptidase [Casimicrobiaceae bacterium]
MLQRLLRALAVLMLAGALAPLAQAQSTSRIRVMLNAYAVADAGDSATLERLQTLAGMPLTPSGSTRTGAQEFTLAQPLDATQLALLTARLREDRSVLWVEPVAAPEAGRAKAKEVASSGLPARKLMIRLAGDPEPEWDSLLQRWQAMTGTPLAVDHRIGNVWVLTLPDAVPAPTLADIAAQLESDPAVKYADAVQRVTIKRVPTDPYYPLQWALSDPVGGVNAPTAWDLTVGSVSTPVAVVDTGYTLHPELSGRILPGYDFVTYTAGGSDPGDWSNDSDCGPNVPGRPSSWHGTFVSGLIAANANNGIGIAGLNWNAKILPVRVLGRCGGTFDDITAGVMWAAGLQVFGVPANPNPARVINMSLGGPTACPQALQEAIDEALAQGAVITVAAGNESYDATGSAPANCSGVITVGASTRQGDRASYSNFGNRVDVSAPGGDGNVSDWILSTSNDGVKSPRNPIYTSEIGTSFAAPHVAGTASLMFARNANLTPGQVLSILTSTARTFPFGSFCGDSGACGAGLLDAGLALQSTIPAANAAPPGTVAVIEYYRADLDHYFMTADPSEIAFVDSMLYPVFQRTGEVFFAWLDPSNAPPGTFLQPVCRFYSPLPLVNSHFYSAVPSECQYVIANWPGVWNLETLAAFYVLMPGPSGACPTGSVPVYRFFDGRNDANWRHSIDLTVRRTMLNRGWASDGIPFCSPA